MLALLVLRFYNFIFWLLTPYGFFFVRGRLKRGREDPDRFRERFGKTTYARPNKGEKIIWVNAVSVGEALAAIPLIERLPKFYDESVRVLLTTTTSTAAKMVRNKLPAHAFHQYAVLDHPLFVRRFLSHWQPAAALWVESELWPNLLVETSKRSIPMGLVNGRLSKKTVRQWSRVKFFSRFLLSHFDICLVQNEENKKDFELLGAPHVHLSGNLKYDAAPLTYDETKKQQWQQQLKGLDVFFAASTHAGEEEAIILAHQALLQQGRKIKTFIAPRHPDRAMAVTSLIHHILGEGTKVGFSKQGDSLDKDIYVINEIGVLGIFYALADVVFMGGSLIPHGGQNPLEPARLDCALLSGRHIFNFQDLYELYEKTDSLLWTNGEDLPEKLSLLFSDREKIKKMAEQGKRNAESLKGALDKTLTLLQPVIGQYAKTT